MNIGHLRDEFVHCDFGDARLSKRILKLAEVFHEHPGRSIPAAFLTRADWEACYRFFDNEAVTPEAILEPHFQHTRERIKECEVAILAQDTTELDLTRPAQQVVGAGVMDGESRRGAFVHPLLAVNLGGVPLGLTGIQHWTREAISRETPAKKRRQRAAKPIEEKESRRWLVGLRQARETALACPATTCVCVGDSEADIYELYALATSLRETSTNLHLLVRAGQDRATSAGALWLVAARQAPLIATQTIHVRERRAKLKTAKSSREKSRQARTAEVEIRARQVEVRRPDHLIGAPLTLTCNVVLVEETHPPEGEDPIRWLLATTLPIDHDSQIESIVRYYCLRWQIEVFFRTLKSGCRVEERRFETLDRVLNCLAMLSVTAWRVMYVAYVGRECPELPCETLFEPSEWRSVYAFLGLPAPKKGCPSLQEVVRAIARLGGFVDRRKNEPGTQSVWIGLQRCYDISHAWEIFGPGAKKISSE